MVYPIQNHAFDVPFLINLMTLLTNIDSNAQLCCTFITTQIPHLELLKLLNNWITNYERSYTVQPLQSLEPDFVKKINQTVEIMIQNSTLATTSTQNSSLRSTRDCTSRSLKREGHDPISFIPQEIPCMLNIQMVTFGGMCVPGNNAWRKMKSMLQRSKEIETEVFPINLKEMYEVRDSKVGLIGEPPENLTIRLRERK